MSKRIVSIAVILLVLAVVVLALAWLDGGREDMRNISNPVETSEFVL